MFVFKFAFILLSSVQASPTQESWDQENSNPAEPKYQNCGLLRDCGGNGPFCPMDLVCDPDPDDNCKYSCKNPKKDENPAKIGEIENPEDDEKRDQIPSVQCVFEDGYQTVSASFPPISTAFSNIDDREYKLYPKAFKASEYKRGMFDEATEECQNLLNKTISKNGVTTFKFVLDHEVIKKCGIKNEENEVEDGKGDTTVHDIFNFAFGYEDLIRKVPGGAEALVQPGKHTNVECDFVNSATIIVEIPASNEVVKEETKVSMDLYPTKKFSPSEKIRNDEDYFVPLGPEPGKNEWIFFEINSPEKWNIEMCKVSASRLNGTDIGEIKFLQNGTKIDNQYADYVWRPRNPEKNPDQFGLHFFEVDHAASYEVDCKLRVSDYDSSEVKSVTVTKTIRHPCQKFGETTEDSVCVPGEPNNCWIRAACQGRFSV